MSSRYHAIESLSNMPVLQALKQPPAVWRCVEREAVRGWRFKCKAEIDNPVGEDLPDEWLKAEHFEGLLARDVPVLRLFTACALRQRAETLE